MTACNCKRGPGEDHHDDCQVTMRSYYDRMARDMRDLLDLAFIPDHVPGEGHAD